ncbi:MAG TPA: ROK family protein [Acidimicrobiales bacterium]|nr:ROK family protein [Acidimicrobiales bacterium]
MELLGIDIGGSGIKGAPVDLDRGELTAERVRIATPQPSDPLAVADVVAEVAAAFDQCGGPVGVTFPGVVRHGVVLTAANVSDAWLGLDADALFTERLNRPVHMINDADAAGVAEAAFGAAAGRSGTVIVLTFGTGIGSGFLVDGQLVPNTELGHLEVDGVDAERRAAASVRKREDLSWEEWAARVDRYLATVEMLFSPDLIVIGGGVSRRADKFLPLLRRRTEIVPAALENQAGIVGAAIVTARLEA